MPRTTEIGSITAEYAVTMPVLVVVAGAILTLSNVCVAQLQCTDAARMAGRQLARGEQPAAVSNHVHQHTHRDTRVEISQANGGISVQVHRSVGLLLPGRPSLHVVGRAEVEMESDLPASLPDPHLTTGTAT